jgi:hypothetical protein
MFWEKIAPPACPPQVMLSFAILRFPLFYSQALQSYKSSFPAHAAVAFTTIFAIKNTIA